MLLLIGLWAPGLFTGCATPVPPSTPPQIAPTTAQVELINLSACAWSVRFTPANYGTAKTTRIPASETVTLTLPAGDYRLTQTALNGLPPPAASRELPATFLAGETYRWPLVTLLTGSAPIP